LETHSASSVAANQPGPLPLWMTAMVSSDVGSIRLTVFVRWFAVQIESKA
jgi:hypothetical protein